MRKSLALLATLAIAAGVSVQTASADPTKAKNSLIVTVVCDDQEIQAVVNGNGAFTPGHVLGTTAVFIPTAFDLTFSFTPTGGTTMTETETVAKANQPANAITCEIPAELNTVTFPDGTFTISGTVTGFFAGSR